MLVKLGVSLVDLKRPIRRALNIIGDVYDSFLEEAVITSTNEGNHSPSSLHYADLAVDVRLPKQMEKIDRVVAKLKVRLGPDYDIVLEKDHLHAEWDLK